MRSPRYKRVPVMMSDFKLLSPCWHSRVQVIQATLYFSSSDSLPLSLDLVTLPSTSTTTMAAMSLTKQALSVLSREKPHVRSLLGMIAPDNLINQFSVFDHRSRRDLDICKLRGGGV